MFDLVGKAAIVTGGGSGIGAAIAQRFRTAGAHVLIADISPEAEARAAEWGCAFLRTNVDEPAGVEALCKEAVNRFGKLDIMINNAGIASGHLLADADAARSEEHTSELQSLMRISYAVFCLKKKIRSTLTVTPLSI